MKLKRRSSRTQQEIALEYSKPNRNNKGRLFDGTTLRMLLLPSPYRRRLRYRQSKSEAKREIDLEDGRRCCDFVAWRSHGERAVLMSKNSHAKIKVSAIYD